MNTYKIVYTFAYQGSAREFGMDGVAYERGFTAYYVAQWCGVSLLWPDE
jgi:hypothetical protein